MALKGLVGRLRNLKSIKGTSTEALRARLIASGVMRPEGETIVFTRDHLFRCPIAAGQTLLCRTCNGWAKWKTHDGRTLDQVNRQAEE